jgi:hypothetical protein
MTEIVVIVVIVGLAAWIIYRGETKPKKPPNTGEDAPWWSPEWPIDVRKWIDEAKERWRK